MASGPATCGRTHTPNAIPATTGHQVSTPPRWPRTNPYEINTMLIIMRASFPDDDQKITEGYRKRTNALRLLCPAGKAVTKTR